MTELSELAENDCVVITMEDDDDDESGSVFSFESIRLAPSSSSSSDVEFDDGSLLELCWNGAAIDTDYPSACDTRHSDGSKSEDVLQEASVIAHILPALDALDESSTISTTNNNNTKIISLIPEERNKKRNLLPSRASPQCELSSPGLFFLVVVTMGFLVGVAG